MPDPQIYCFPAKRMGFPVVSARGISFLRDLEEQDTDGKLSAVTLQEHACSCSSSFLEPILWTQRANGSWGAFPSWFQCSPLVMTQWKPLGISVCAVWTTGIALLAFSCRAVHLFPPLLQLCIVLPIWLIVSWGLDDFFGVLQIQSPTQSFSREHSSRRTGAGATRTGNWGSTREFSGNERKSLSVALCCSEHTVGSWEEAQHSALKTIHTQICYIFIRGRNWPGNGYKTHILNKRREIYGSFVNLSHIFLHPPGRNTLITNIPQTWTHSGPGIASFWPQLQLKTW